MPDDSAAPADDRPSDPTYSVDYERAVARKMRALGLSTGSDYWVYVHDDPELVALRRSRSAPAAQIDQQRSLEPPVARQPPVGDDA
ncbi:hypothetical protein OG777_27335 [Micromonospora peucetia]|uniref:Uncharacterized protein n=1 Tax=Micromonospora peucetia TaxID=47871 RepID=A0A1C6VZC5_9ACTN|nr:hypothetical protein [Micromonospora peucetia]MCX4390613.1 hypothetical protein [Micromonospora peucetia]SCL71250.1 hypothetical protein GA0070608_4588 [Micromonospora peucetia]